MVILQQLTLLLASWALFMPVSATSGELIDRQVNDLLSRVPKDLIGIQSIDHDAVHIWLVEQKKQNERIDYYLEYLVRLNQDADCDGEFREKTRRFLSLIEDDRAKSPLGHYFRYYALKRLEKCLKHQDWEWSLSSKWIAEWALDRFYKAAFDLDKQANESQLLERVSKFDLTSSDHFDHLAAAKMVIAFRDSERRSSVFTSPGNVLADSKPINRHYERLLRDGLKQSMSEVTLKHCAERLGDFIDRKCHELGRYRPMFDIIDLARALGSNKLARFGSRRVLKLVEYTRVCKGWRENDQVIRFKLEAAFEGSDCAADQIRVNF